MGIYYTNRGHVHRHIPCSPFAFRQWVKSFNQDLSRRAVAHAKDVDATFGFVTNRYCRGMRFASEAACSYCFRLSSFLSN